MAAPSTLSRSGRLWKMSESASRPQITLRQGEGVATRTASGCWCRTLGMQTVWAGRQAPSEQARPGQPALAARSHGRGPASPQVAHGHRWRRPRALQARGERQLVHPAQQAARQQGARHRRRRGHPEAASCGAHQGCSRGRTRVEGDDVRAWAAWYGRLASRACRAATAHGMLPAAQGQLALRFPACSCPLRGSRPAPTHLRPAGQWRLGRR